MAKLCMTAAQARAFKDQEKAWKTFERAKASLAAAKFTNRADGVALEKFKKAEAAYATACVKFNESVSSK